MPIREASSCWVNPAAILASRKRWPNSLCIGTDRAGPGRFSIHRAVWRGAAGASGIIGVLSWSRPELHMRRRRPDWQRHHVPKMSQTEPRGQELAPFPAKRKVPAPMQVAELGGNPDRYNNAT